MKFINFSMVKITTILNNSLKGEIEVLKKLKNNQYVTVKELITIPDDEFEKVEDYIVNRYNCDGANDLINLLTMCTEDKSDPNLEKITTYKDYTLYRVKHSFEHGFELYFCTVKPKSFNDIILAHDLDYNIISECCLQWPEGFYKNGEHITDDNEIQKCFKIEIDHYLNNEELEFVSDTYR